MSSVHAPTCTTCQQSFDSISQFTQHLLDKHAERDNHTCSLCHYCSNSESDLKEHIFKEHEKCEYCNIQLKDSEALANHSADKHKFVCKECKVEYNSLSTLESHSITHVREDEPIEIPEQQQVINCPECNLDFENNFLLDEHIKVFHIFKCDLCGFTGQHETQMEDHIMLKHFMPDEDNQFSCDECSYNVMTEKC